MQDSIPIHRDTLKHWIYSDAEYFKVWVTMLARARYLKEPKTIMYEKALCTLNYGEFIFGYKAWSDKTGVSYQRLRGLVKKLLIDKMLRITVTTNHYTVYEVVNYSKFNSQPMQEIQGVEESTNSQVTVSQQSGNSQVTTNKEYIKKEKKVETEKTNIYTPEFESFWTAYPVAGYQNSKPQAFKNFKSLIKKKVSVDSIIQAAKNYATDCEALCKTNYLYKASNFIGQAEYYKSYLDEFWEPAQQELFNSQQPKQSKRDQQLNELERILDDYDRSNVQDNARPMLCELS